MRSLNISELTLVQRAQEGEAAAVAELYERHSSTIFRYFLFRAPDRATAEDLTGEVFVKMVEGLPHYQERGVPIMAWLYRIAHDRLVDYHRRSAVRQTEALSDDLESEAPGTEAEALGRAEIQHVLAFMQGLTEDQRTVVQLRFMEDYSLEDCARVLGKTQGAIKAIQHRALRQLGKKLRR